MLDQIIKSRLEKLKKYSKVDNPYPAKIKRDLSIGDFVQRFEDLTRKKGKFYLVGRVKSFRDQGGIVFADVEDESGQVQFIFSKEKTKNFSFIKEVLDLGDFIECEGTPLISKRGEKSLQVDSSRIICKSLRPIPKEWYGLKDIENRLRKRYLDFIFNKHSKKIIELRSKIIFELRRLLFKENFIEVETPILQPIYGGAKAEPFVSHWLSLKKKVYLRIAPELYLKRLLVGGFEKVFEIGKNFRNEGIDFEHYPEFTMMELYIAYKDYNFLMDFTQNLLEKLSKNLGFQKFAAPFKKITFYKALGEKYKNLCPQEQDEIIKKEIIPKIDSPTFIIDYPKELIPLAKTKEEDKNLAERFQLVVRGVELANGYTELNDPLEQRERLRERLKGSEIDKDFLQALEYGMPPACGLGIGIDRLIALMTDSHSIRETITFPMLK